MADVNSSVDPIASNITSSLGLLSCVYVEDVPENKVKF